MTTNTSPKQWFRECISGDEEHRHSIAEKFLNATTDFQEMQMLRLSLFGKALVLDGKIQSAQRDEFIYHESLVHPGLLTLDRPKRALVIGGGEGATLREIFRYSSIEKAVMVDIDRAVVDACKEHLAEFHQGAFDDSRCELVIDDAKAYVANCKESFDFIIIDISEALEGTTAAFMYTQEFYQQLADLLVEDGKVVIQSGSLSIVELDFFMRVNKTLKTVFPQVMPYSAYVPAYAAMWGFHLAAKKPSAALTAEQVDTKLEQLGFNADLRFLDGEAYVGMSHLPKYLRETIKQDWKIYSAADKPAIYKPESPKA